MADEEEETLSTPSTVHSSQSEIQYECRLCPGEKFTAAEKDLHRARHNAADKAKPTKSRKRRGRGNSPSARSELTLFEEIATPPRATPSPAKRGRGRPPTKKRSNKTYKSGVTGKWVRGKSG